MSFPINGMDSVAAHAYITSQRVTNIVEDTSLLDRRLVSCTNQTLEIATRRTTDISMSCINKIVHTR